MTTGLITKQRAFTLIEMLIVVVVLIILISFFSPVIKSALLDAKRGAATAQLTAIGQACESYYLTFEAYPGYWSNQQIAGAQPVPASIWKQFTGTENMVVSLMGHMSFGSTTPLETVRGVSGLPDIEKLDARRIGEGPVVQLPGNKGVKKYGAFYSPKSTEMMAIGGTQNSQDLTDDNNIPEFIDASCGLPILYLRSGGQRAQMVDIGVGDAGCFAIRHIKDYVAASNLRSANGEVHDQTLNGGASILGLNTDPNSTEAGQLAWLVINTAMSEVTSVAGTNGSANDSKGDVPRGQFLLMAPGPDGVYFSARDLIPTTNTPTVSQLRNARIDAPGKVGVFDDVIYAGGGAR